MSVCAGAHCESPPGSDDHSSDVAPSSCSRVHSATASPSGRATTVAAPRRAVPVSTTSTASHRRLVGFQRRLFSAMRFESRCVSTQVSRIDPSCIARVVGESADQPLGGSPTVSHAPHAPRARSKRRASMRCRSSSVAKAKTVNEVPSVSVVSSSRSQLPFSGRLISPELLTRRATAGESSPPHAGSRAGSSAASSAARVRVTRMERRASPIHLQRSRPRAQRLRVTVADASAGRPTRSSARPGPRCRSAGG